MKRKRLLYLAGVGVALTIAALAYIQFYFARPIGSGPAGPAVAREPFAKTWSDRQVLLLGVGDSVTAGLGAKSSSHGYFQRLYKNPNDEFAELRGVCLASVLPNLKILNLAISGSTSITHAEVLNEKLDIQSADIYGIVVMTSGGNDLIHSYGRSPARECAMFGATTEQAKPWIANFELRFGKMLDEIIEKFPGGCEIHLADIYDPTDGVGDGASVFLPAWDDGLVIHGEYNRVINRCADARQQVHVVPMHKTFLGHGSHCRQFWRSFYDASDPHYWYYENIEDPNDRGYDAIRRLFLNSIVEHSALNPGLVAK